MTDAQTRRPDSAPVPRHTPRQAPPAPDTDPVVPVGYRQGFITAISVLLAFSLAFWRYWSFEAPGSWTPLAMVVEAGIALAAALQAVALFRSLRVEDDRVPEYHRTQRWLRASAVVLIAALAGALADDLFPV